MRRKYFFFDIDGTLTDGTSFTGGIPKSAKDAIRKLKENGHEVAIATGRPYSAAKVFAAEAGIKNIVCNGGYASYINGKCIENRSMLMEDCQRVMQECLEKEIPFCVSLDENFTFLTHNDAFREKVNPHEFRAELLIDEDIKYTALTAIYRMMIAIERDEESALTNFGTLVPSRYNKSFVIVEPDDKYHGVRCMLKALNGLSEDVVVFGDGRNDMKMFAEAPFSIAMGNGVEQLKEMANFVTKRSDEDGLAYALEYFGWV